MKNWTLLEKIFLLLAIIFLIIGLTFFILIIVLTIKYWNVPDSELSE